MRKTSVYLTQDEADGLRRLAVREGRPQAELIREGIRRVIAGAADHERRFRSLAVGASGGQKAGRWTSEELYGKTRGER
jgi:predicted DNA-binding protein